MCRGQWAGALPARLSIDLVALHSQWFCLLPFLTLQPSGLTSVPQAHLPLFDIKHTCCSAPAGSLASTGCLSGRRAYLTWSGGPTCVTEGPTSVFNVGARSKGHLCSLSPPPVEGTKDDPRAQAGIKPSPKRSFPTDLSRPAWSTPLRPSCPRPNPAWVFLWSVAPAALPGEQGAEVLPPGSVQPFLLLPSSWGGRRCRGGWPCPGQTPGRTGLHTRGSWTWPYTPSPYTPTGRARPKIPSRLLMCLLKEAPSASASCLVSGAGCPGQSTACPAGLG